MLTEEFGGGIVIGRINLSGLTSRANSKRPGKWGVLFPFPGDFGYSGAGVWFGTDSTGMVAESEAAGREESRSISPLRPNKRRSACGRDDKGCGGTRAESYQCPTPSHKEEREKARADGLGRPPLQKQRRGKSIGKKRRPPQNRGKEKARGTLKARTGE